MGWIVFWSWLAAIVFALVVIGFCAYEVFWKVSRLNSDIERLVGLSERLTELQGGFTTTAERVGVLSATVGSGSAAPGRIVVQGSTTQANTNQANTAPATLSRNG